MKLNAKQSVKKDSSSGTCFDVDFAGTVSLIVEQQSGIHNKDPDAKVLKTIHLRTENIVG
jgi:hypothetical protein